MHGCCLSSKECNTSVEGVLVVICKAGMHQQRHCYMNVNVWWKEGGVLELVLLDGGPLYEVFPRAPDPRPWVIPRLTHIPPVLPNTGS